MTMRLHIFLIFVAWMFSFTPTAYADEMIRKLELSTLHEYAGRWHETCKSPVLMSCGVYRHPGEIRYSHIERELGADTAQYLSQHYGCAYQADGHLGWTSFGRNNTDAEDLYRALGRVLAATAIQTIAQHCQPCSEDSDMPRELKELCLTSSDGKQGEIKGSDYCNNHPCIVEPTVTEEEERRRKAACRRRCDNQYWRCRMAQGGRGFLAREARCARIRKSCRRYC